MPFGHLESGENHLVFSQTTYIYLSKDGAYISPNGVQFAAVCDTKTLKNLYDANQGTIIIGFAITKDGGATLQTGVSLK